MSWKVNLLGKLDGDSYELSVVQSENAHGSRSYGWFDSQKLLICHNGGPCRTRLAPGLGPVMLRIAQQYAEHLNAGLPPLSFTENT